MRAALVYSLLASACYVAAEERSVGAFEKLAIWTLPLPYAKVRPNRRHRRLVVLQNR